MARHQEQAADRPAVGSSTGIRSRRRRGCSIPKTRVFVSYEDPRSIGIRAQLAKDRGLRGVFMWELTGDDEQHSLLQAMVRPFE